MSRDFNQIVDDEGAFVLHNSILFNLSNAKHKLTSKQSLNFEYKNVEFLKEYLSEGGKILSRNYTGLSAQQQRQLKKAVKRARHLGLLPFVAI